jgi:hypothetical protein
MGRIIATEHISLDGVVEPRDQATSVTTGTRPGSSTSTAARPATATRSTRPWRRRSSCSGFIPLTIPLPIESLFRGEIDVAEPYDRTTTVAG